MFIKFGPWKIRKIHNLFFLPELRLGKNKMFGNLLHFECFLSPLRLDLKVLGQDLGPLAKTGQDVHVPY